MTRTSRCTWASRKVSATAVPLQVILYEETKAFAEYIEAESQFLSHVFSPLPGEHPVIQVQQTRDYDGLRDYCHLPVHTHLPFTLVFMVDGYWALGRGPLSSLRSQRTYLFEPLTNYDDVFRLYRPTRQQSRRGAVRPRGKDDSSSAADAAARVSAAREDEGPPRRDRRIDYFSQPAAGINRFFYKSRLVGQSKEVDRVPFMWDFGFLLCSEHQWNTAAAIQISARTPEGSRYTVGDVWHRLRRLAALEVTPANPAANVPKRRTDMQEQTTLTLDVEAILGPPQLQPGAPPNVTWREFLEASFAVAQAEERRTGHKGPVFDLAMATPESILCWLVEVWFSEMVDDGIRLRACAKALEASTDEADSNARGGRHHVVGSIVQEAGRLLEVGV